MSATIEKIDMNDSTLSQGLTLKYHLCTLKLFRAEVEHRPLRSDMDERPAILKIWKAGFDKATECFPFLSGIRDQVRHFFISLECLIYFCYFALMVDNTSQSYQFGSVIKSHIDTFIKKVEEEDKNNLLIEVMIFSKKYQIAKHLRFELYYLIMVALVFYGISLSKVDQNKKAYLYLEKVIILCTTIEPGSKILAIVENLLITIKAERLSAVTYTVPSLSPNEQKPFFKDQLAAEYQIRVTEERDSEVMLQQKIRLEQKVEENKKEKLSKLVRKQLFSEQLFIPGVQSTQLVQNTNQFTKQNYSHWKQANQKEKESSVRQTIIQEYDAIEERETTFLNNSQHKEIKVIETYTRASRKIAEEDEQSKEIKPSSNLQTPLGKSRSINNLFSKKVRPNTANQSLAVSRDNKVRSNRAIDLAMHSPVEGSVLYVKDKRAVTNNNEDRDQHQGANSRPMSIAMQLKTLLYKADIKEMMPDQYLFNKFKIHKNESRQSRWTHDKRTTMATDSSSGFNIDQNWFLDRMMASRLEKDESRVLTNNNTMSIKNQQVMIEFKTGDHPEPSAPKKRAPSAYMKRSFLIKCSYDGNGKGMVQKGRVLGYTDYQYDERKKSYDQHQRSMKTSANVSSTINLGPKPDEGIRKSPTQVSRAKTSSMDNSQHFRQLTVSNTSMKGKRTTESVVDPYPRTRLRSASRNDDISEVNGRRLSKEGSASKLELNRERKLSRRASLYPEKEGLNNQEVQSHSSSRHMSEGKRSQRHIKDAVQKVQRAIAVQKRLMQEGKLPKNNIHENFFENLRSSSGFVVKEVGLSRQRISK